MLTPLKYVWAGPNTLLALFTAFALWLFSFLTRHPPRRVRFAVVEGVVEVSGGLVADVLGLMPTSGSLRQPGGAAALTLGHLVFALSPDDLDRTRLHESVHVRQYERWGPLFVPAYFAASFLAARRGQHAYLDNRFEREAYAVSDGQTPQ